MTINLIVNLTTLTVAQNKIFGPLPLSLPTSLTTLLFSDNSFTGSIPEAYSNLKKLTIASFSNNLLSASLPAFLPFSTSIENLYLAFNRFYGSIPSTIIVFSRLSVIDLRGNLLTGAIPTALTSLNLMELSLSGNYFDAGPIPKFISKLTAIQVLGLSSKNIFYH